MKKIFFAMFIIGLLFSGSALCQINFEKTDESSAALSEKSKEAVAQTDFFSDFIEDVEAEKNAQMEAKQLLETDQQTLKLRQSQLKELERNRLEREKLRQKFLTIEQAKMKPEEKVQNIMESYEAAPLGLNWAITPEKMQQIGYELERVERDDYSNSYLVKNADEKGAKGYENVVVSFGENNALWCINALTAAQKDDAAANEVLKQYEKYFEALQQKYGNANEHFTPYSYEEKIIEGEGDEKVERIVKKENQRGNPNFLKELQSGKAELYATFHNNSVGVTLSVYVDENGLAQLVLDYKNLPLMKKEKEAFINNL